VAARSQLAFMRGRLAELRTLNAGREARAAAAADAAAALAERRAAAAAAKAALEIELEALSVSAPEAVTPVQGGALGRQLADRTAALDILSGLLPWSLRAEAAAPGAWLLSFGETFRCRLAPSAAGGEGGMDAVVSLAPRAQAPAPGEPAPAARRALLGRLLPGGQLAVTGVPAAALRGEAQRLSEALGRSADLAAELDSAMLTWPLLAGAALGADGRLRLTFLNTETAARAELSLPADAALPGGGAPLAEAVAVDEAWAVRGPAPSAAAFAAALAAEEGTFGRLHRVCRAATRVLRAGQAGGCAAAEAAPAGGRQVYLM